MTGQKRHYGIFTFIIYIYIFPIGILKGLKMKIIFRVVLLLAAVISVYAQTSITISTESNQGKLFPKVTLDNSVSTAHIRPVAVTGVNIKDTVEHAIRNWYLKSIGQDLVLNKLLDACAQRGSADTAFITENTLDRKTVRVIFRHILDKQYEGISDYTVFSDRPFIKIRYEKYEYKNGWANTVDNVDNIIQVGSIFKIYGQDEYGPLEYYPGAYWDTIDSLDALTAGALNYNKHIIMTLSNQTSGLGFCRIMPVYAANVNAGIRILKLLNQSNKGLETFKATGGANHKPFNAYIFMFTEGADAAIEYAKLIIDTDGEIPLPVELISFNAAINNESGNSVKLTWKTATEVNNYGFEIQWLMDNGKWERIGFLEGAGNSNSTLEYSFIDNFPESEGSRRYRLKQIDLDGKFSYSKEITIELNTIPTQFSLLQNFPNPFNPATTIRYSIPSGVEILHATTLRVYDILGREVAVLVNQNQPAGNYEVKFDASQLSSGIYFYIIQAGGFMKSRKMLLQK